MADSVISSAVAVQRAQVMTALRAASAATGADFSYLVKTAQRESNFDPSAKAPTSSATGLFQFTRETWLNVVERYGAQHNINTEGMSRADILALRNDPDLSARMAGELSKENAKILGKKLGRQATSAELYTAHFMGPQDAARLIKAARTNSDGAAAEMFPRAALANASVFRGKESAALTPAQLYVKLTGVEVAMADAGKVPAGAFTAPVAPATQADPSVILQARLGATQLASSLMTALFDLQDDTKKS
ncbi:MAG: transglycosylase SLT domain-containing protein [Hyphomonadaceae bacterium]|nr:transglycosylase SLT domain-containing protein [Hyphomonadaceae bacterium]